MLISSKLQNACKQLLGGDIKSAQLDVEILLAYVLDVERSWLHAHDDQELTTEQVEQFEALVERRVQREPVAYLVGKKEFYGRDFIVRPDVLIPRPETEDLIDLALRRKDDGESDNGTDVLDVGCGSGCIGITLKLEYPEWNVTLSDISQKALRVAKKNADRLGAAVELLESDLMSWFIVRPRSFDLIIANLPYVHKVWETSPETAYEPSTALFADEEGLALIRKLIVQSPPRLNLNGRLLLEADPEQHEQVISFAKTHSLIHQETRGYALSFVKQP